MHVKCPDCPKTIDSEAANREVTSRLAQHMSQRSDHPYSSHSEAEAAIREAGGIEALAVEKDDDPSDPSPNGPFDPTEDAPNGNPLLRVPLMADGGETECPECEEPMSRQDGGQPFRGVLDGEVVKRETEDGDMYCPDCRIVSDGDIITDVEPL